jgi:hypothetical protein
MSDLMAEARGLVIGETLTIPGQFEHDGAAVE